MGQALYRTYRSKKLSEIVGQEHITTALRHALQKGTISHAYLFTGPRGVGKTSIARILAHEINGLPYSEDRPHLDIIEIDAASNRRIDEIRDLREKVHIAPSSAKYKVYIIDEVHMLTKEAFNALLKTLEEPPAHVVFILATTEAHKLPETIISRTQRFSFKPVEADKVVAHLKQIAKTEQIAIDDEALALVAAHGEGSFRDSISLLDQVRNTPGKVTLGTIQAVLGIAPEERITNLLAAVKAHDAVGVVRGLQAMHDQGYEAAQIARQLGNALRGAILAGTPPLGHHTLMQLLGQLVQVPASPSPRLALEISLLDAAHPESATDTHTSAASNPPVARPAKPATVKGADHPKSKTEPKAMPEAVQAQPSLQADPHLVLSEKAWDMVLHAIKQKHNTLYSIIKLTRPRFEPGRIVLECGFSFHQKRLNETRNQQTLSVIIAEITGNSMQVNCILSEEQAASPLPSLPSAGNETVHAANAAPSNPDQGRSLSASTTPKTENTGHIAAISNIFGGAELLES